MKKIILPPEKCLSFFFSLEKCSSSGRKALRSYLYPLLQKSYPMLSDSVVWDFFVFTVEGKKWASVCVTEKETLAEMRLRYPGCVLYTLSSCVCGGKNFASGYTYIFGNEKVFYDRKNGKPVCIPDTEGSCSIAFSERVLLSIRSAKAVFVPEKTGFIRICVLVFVFSALVLFFVLTSGKTKTGSPEIPEEIPVLQKEEESPDSEEKESRSCADYFLECAEALYGCKALLVSFLYEKNGKITFEFLSGKPSEVIALLEGSPLFDSVEVKSLVLENGDALCCLEISAPVLTGFSREDSAVYPERLKELVSVPAGSTYSFSGAEGSTVLCFSERPEKLEPCLESIFGCAEKEGAKVSSIEIRDEKNDVSVRCVFEGCKGSGKDNEYDFSLVRSLFPARKTVAAAAQPEPRIEERKAFIGKSRNADGTYSYFYRSEDGKIVSETRQGAFYEGE